MTKLVRRIFHFSILAAIGLFLVAAIILAGRNSKSSESRVIIPVIANQMPAQNGIIPVELFCDEVETTSVREVGGFKCRLRNNTKKTINAISIAHNIVTEKDGERGGKESSDKGFLTIETVLHPDLQNSHLHRAIEPGQERPLELSETTIYDDAIIKRIEVGVDYVEYDDDTVQGPDEQGSHILASLRKGAARYKEWLVQKYLQNGNSIDMVVQLLSDQNPLPADAGLGDMYLRQGAKVYRSHLLTINNTRGAKELSDILNRGK